MSDVHTIERIAPVVVAIALSSKLLGAAATQPLPTSEPIARTTLSFASSGYTGTIPTEFGLLTDLTQSLLLNGESGLRSILSPETIHPTRAPRHLHTTHL